MTIDQRWIDFIIDNKDRPAFSRAIQIIIADERLSEAFYNFTGENLSEIINRQ
jgi:hypothetical protein